MLLQVPAPPRTLPGFERLFSSGACRGRLLLVDDLIDLRDILELILRRDGYRVRAGANGLECLRLARTMRPDLILLNYLMPVMDGLTALRELKKDPTVSYLKVVMYSAVGSDSSFWSAAREAGALGLLHSPFGVRDLLSMVEKALRTS